MGMVLSYEEFTRWEGTRGAPDALWPRYNNFPLRFHPNGNYVDVWYVERFRREYPDLYENLSAAVGEVWELMRSQAEKIGSFIRDSKHIGEEDLEKLFLEKQEEFQGKLRQIEPDLYEAYRIMRGYGCSDDDLFR